MASNYTTNYALPLWEPQDSFLRTEFNEAHQKIDDALGAMATKGEVTAQVGQAEEGLTGALSALTARVAALEGQLPDRARIAAGSYTGTGEVGAGHPNTLTLPFPPKLVVIGEDTNHSVLVRPCTRAAGQVLAHGRYGVLHLTWSGNSVSWYADGYYNGAMYDTGGLASHQLNEEGTEYFYLAIG